MSENNCSKPELIIDPKRYKRDITVTGFLVFWGLGVIALLIVGIIYKIVFMIVLSSLFLLILPFVLPNWNHKEFFTIEGENLKYSKGSKGNVKKTFSKSTDLELTIECVDSGGDSEFGPTLNLWSHSHGSKDRTVLAYWVNLDGKTELLHELRNFLKANSFKCDARVESAVINSFRSRSPRLKEITQDRTKRST